MGIQAANTAADVSTLFGKGYFSFFLSLSPATPVVVFVSIVAVIRVVDLPMA